MRLRVMWSVWINKYAILLVNSYITAVSSAHRHILLKLLAHQHRPVAPIMLREGSRVYLTFQVRDILLLTIGENKGEKKGKVTTKPFNQEKKNARLSDYCVIKLFLLEQYSLSDWLPIQNIQTRTIDHNHRISMLYANLHCKACMQSIHMGLTSLIIFTASLMRPSLRAHMANLRLMYTRRFVSFPADERTAISIIIRKKNFHTQSKHKCVCVFHLPNFSACLKSLSASIIVVASSSARSTYAAAHLNKF